MSMSSYLVAFVVGPLEATDWVDVDGIPLRVVHVPGKGHLTAFALDVGAFCLRWFQNYYGIPYPSDKVDLLALPDFAAGAMENLGCITFRENLLLVDPATATQGERELVADVVAHELAHMWFGDLVTMEWWNGIWLNEAFATFMEIAACDAYAPDWQRWTTFGLERSAAFETDSLSSTRSVEYEVRSPADCEGMFDVLTYQKGGALLRMLEQYLGDERFREGVSHYLRTHAYGNTDTGDLWDAIEHTSGEPVRRIMDSWIWQPGYPLVSARVDGDELVLDQRRFTFDAEAASDSLVGDPDQRPAGGRRCRACCSTAIEVTAAARRGTRWWSTPAGTASTGSSYSDELRGRITDSAVRRRCRRSSATTSSTTRGTRSPPGRWTRWSGSPSPSASSTSASTACGRASPSACAAVRRLIGEDDVALGGLPGARPCARSHRRSPSSASRPRASPT